MFEKVNPSHPDKIADRIAGALVGVGNRHAERYGEDPGRSKEEGGVK